MGTIVNQSLLIDFQDVDEHKAISKGAQIGLKNFIELVLANRYGLKNKNVSVTTVDDKVVEGATDQYKPKLRVTYNASLTDEQQLEVSKLCKYYLVFIRRAFDNKPFSLETQSEFEEVE